MINNDYIGNRNPNDGTVAQYTDKEMLEATQRNAAKRPNRFWARKLAEKHLI